MPNLTPSKILEDLLDSAYCAKAHFGVFWAQKGEAKPNKSSQVYSHSQFFLISQDAHYIAFFVYLSHLFDRQKDSSSIQKYLSISKDTFETSVFEDFQSRHAALAERVKPLIVARHKTIAHVDAELTQDNVFSTIDINWRGIREIIYDSAALVSDLAIASNLPPPHTPPDRYFIDATLKLIDSFESSSLTPLIN